jgi:hypothetical protein
MIHWKFQMVSYVLFSVIFATFVVKKLWVKPRVLSLTTSPD